MGDCLSKKNPAEAILAFRNNKIVCCTSGNCEVDGEQQQGEATTPLVEKVLNNELMLTEWTEKQLLNKT
ncbi:MAG: hypothetical protein ACRCX2_39265 [Paraclostridium sp.]